MDIEFEFSGFVWVVRVFFIIKFFLLVEKVEEELGLETLREKFWGFNKEGIIIVFLIESFEGVEGVSLFCVVVEIR